MAKIIETDKRSRFFLIASSSRLIGIVKPVVFYCFSLGKIPLIYNFSTFFTLFFVVGSFLQVAYAKTIDSEISRGVKSQVCSFL